MVDFNIDKLVSLAGGRFRLVTLMQKRMRELQRGLPPLVDKEGSLLETAVQELSLGKLWLAMGAEADKLRDERAAERHVAAPQQPPTLPDPTQAPRKPE